MAPGQGGIRCQLGSDWESGLTSNLKRTFITVIGSSVEPGRQDQKLLTLWTKERGPISFMLTRKAIEILREVLTESPDQHSVSEPADRVLREANASFDHPPGG